MPRVCSGAASALVGVAPSNCMAITEVSGVRLMFFSLRDTEYKVVPAGVVPVIRKGAFAVALMATLILPLASVALKPTLVWLASYTLMTLPASALPVAATTLTMRAAATGAAALPGVSLPPQAVSPAPSARAREIDKVVRRRAR